MNKSDMWYQLGRMKLAGADSVLQGAMSIKGTIQKTLDQYMWVYSLEGLPSDNSIRNYYKSELPKIFRRMQVEISEADSSSQSGVVKAAVQELTCATDFLRRIIQIYLGSAKHQHLANVMYEELAKTAQMIQKLVPAHAEYFYKPKNNLSADSYYLSDLLGTGYNTLLNLEKTGLRFPAQFKFAVMSGMDIKSNPSLANDQFRPLMVDYITQKYPFYKRFIISNGDDSSLAKTIQELTNPTPEFLQELQDSLLPNERVNLTQPWLSDNIDPIESTRFMASAIFKCGLPTTDLLKYLAATSSYVSPNEACQSETLISQVGGANMKSLNEVINVLVDTSSTTLPITSLTKMLTTFMYSVPDSPRSRMTEESIKKLKSCPQLSEVMAGLWENRKTNSIDQDKLIKMGVAPWEDTLAYARRYPRAVSSIMGWSSRQKELNAAANQQDKKNEALDETRKLEQDKLSASESGSNKSDTENPDEIPTSLLHQQILNGSVDASPLSEAANGRYLKIALEIGQSMRLSPEVVQKWAESIQLYTIKNSQFASALSESKATNYDTVNDFSSALGMFTNGFSRDEKPRDRKPSIFLQTHMIRAQHDNMRIFEVLNVPPQVSEDAVAAHEIAHALNFIATNGNMLRNTYTSGNKGRDYLTDYPEIVARVYGEIPLWRKAIYDQINSMRETDLIKEAVTEEFTETAMTHEANEAIGGIDPIKEYERAKLLLHPYNLTEDPIKAANLRVERAKSRVKGALYQMSQDRRRDILLDVLKKINSCKAQMDALTKIEQSKGENDYDTQAEFSEEMKRLKRLKVQVMNGGFDLELDSAVDGVIGNFLTRNLAGMANSVNNANWKPPTTLVSLDAEENHPELASGTEPMGYHELKEIAGNDFDWSGGVDGGRSLSGPKNMEMYMPTHSVDYEKNFRTKILPKFTLDPEEELTSTQDSLKQQDSKEQYVEQQKEPNATQPLTASACSWWKTAQKTVQKNAQENAYAYTS